MEGEYTIQGWRNFYKIERSGELVLVFYPQLRQFGCSLYRWEDSEPETYTWAIVWIVDTDFLAIGPFLKELRLRAGYIGACGLWVGQLFRGKVAHSVTGTRFLRPVQPMSINHNAACST